MKDFKVETQIVIITKGEVITKKDWPKHSTLDVNDYPSRVEYNIALDREWEALITEALAKN